MKPSRSKPRKSHSKSSKQIMTAKEDERGPTENLKKNDSSKDSTKEMAANSNPDTSKAADANLLSKDQPNGSLKSDSLSGGVTALEQKDSFLSNCPETKDHAKPNRPITLKPKRSKYVAQLFKIFKNA